MVDVAAVAAADAVLEIVGGVRLQKSDLVVPVVRRPAGLSGVSLLRVAALRLVDVPYRETTLRHRLLESHRLSILDQQVLAGRIAAVDTEHHGIRLDLGHGIAGGRADRRRSDPAEGHLGPCRRVRGSALVAGEPPRVGHEAVRAYA